MRLKFNLILVFFILLQVNFVIAEQEFNPEDSGTWSYTSAEMYGQLDLNDPRVDFSQIPVNMWSSIDQSKITDPIKISQIPAGSLNLDQINKIHLTVEQILPNIDKISNLKDLDSSRVSEVFSSNYGINLNIDLAINVKFDSMTGKLSGDFGSYDPKEYPQDKFKQIIEGKTVKIIPLNSNTQIEPSGEVTITGANTFSRQVDGSIKIVASDTEKVIVTGNQKGVMILSDGRTIEFESKSLMSSFYLENNGNFNGNDAIARIRENGVIIQEIKGTFQKNKEGFLLYPYDGVHSSFEDFERKIKISSTGVNSLFVGQIGIKEPEGNFVLYDKNTISAKGQFGIEQNDLKVLSKDKDSIFSINEKKEISAKGILEVETSNYKYLGLTKSTLLNSRVENGKDVVKITGDDEGKIAKLSKKVSIITTYSGQKVYTTSEKELLTEIFNTKGKISLKLDLNSDKILKGIVNSKDNYIYIKNDLIVELGEEGKSKLTISKDLGVVYESNGKKSESFSYNKVLDVIGEKYIDLNERLIDLSNAIKSGKGDISTLKKEKETIEFMLLGKKLEGKSNSEIIVELKKYLEKNPSSEMKGAVQVELAKQYLKKEDIISAHEILLQTKKDPKTFEQSSIMLAVIYAQRGEMNYADKELRDILEKNPKNTDAIILKNQLDGTVLKMINTQLGAEQSALIAESLKKVGANDNLAVKLGLNFDSILGRTIGAADMDLGQTMAIFSGQLKYLETITDEELKKATEVQMGISTMSYLMKKEGLTLAQVAQIKDPSSFSKVMGINYDGLSEKEKEKAKLEMAQTYLNLRSAVSHPDVQVLLSPDKGNKQYTWESGKGYLDTTAFARDWKDNVNDAFNAKNIFLFAGMGLGATNVVSGTGKLMATENTITLGGRVVESLASTSIGNGIKTISNSNLGIGISSLVPKNALGQTVFQIGTVGGTAIGVEYVIGSLGGTEGYQIGGAVTGSIVAEIMVGVTQQKVRAVNAIIRTTDDVERTAQSAGIRLSESELKSAVTYRQNVDGTFTPIVYGDHFSVGQVKALEDAKYSVTEIKQGVSEIKDTLTGESVLVLTPSKTGELPSISKGTQIISEEQVVASVVQDIKTQGTILRAEDAMAKNRAFMTANDAKFDTELELNVIGDDFIKSVQFESPKTFQSMGSAMVGQDVVDLAKAGKVDEAIFSYKSLIKQTDGFAPESVEQAYWNALITKSRQLEKSGDYVEAARLYKEATRNAQGLVSQSALDTINRHSDELLEAYWKRAEISLRIDDAETKIFLDKLGQYQGTSPGRGIVIDDAGVKYFQKDAIGESAMVEEVSSILNRELGLLGQDARAIGNGKVVSRLLTENPTTIKDISVNQINNLDEIKRQSVIQAFLGNQDINPGNIIFVPVKNVDGTILKNSQGQNLYNGIYIDSGASSIGIKDANYMIDFVEKSLPLEFRTGAQYSDFEKTIQDLQKFDDIYLAKMIEDFKTRGIIDEYKTQKIYDTLKFRRDCIGEYYLFKYEGKKVSSKCFI